MIQARALRKNEVVATAYFTYTALLATARRTSLSELTAACLLPITIFAMSRWAQRSSGNPRARVARDWLPMGLILVAYWQMAWFRTTLPPWDQTWIGLDRILFHGGFRAGIEVLGPAIPWVLEVVYLCLYAIPPICMAALYLTGERREAHQFLFMLLLGTFTVYGLLPYFPSASPRITFPSEDLPHYESLWRSINVWLLDHYDISTGIFPSGHVAVAFSSAYGVLLAAPARRRLWGSVFVAATLVFTATIYGRYHYAADGIASILITTVCWRITRRMRLH